MSERRHPRPWREPWPSSGRAAADGAGASGRAGFVSGFEAVFAHAQATGELPAEISSAEMAQMLQALVMDSIHDWALAHADLEPALRRRTTLLVAGLKARAPEPSGRVVGA